MSHLVDTDWLVDMLRGRSAAASRIARLTNSSLFISVITYGELWDGITSSINSAQQEADVHTLLQGFDILPATEPILQRFGQLRSNLRRAGLTIGELDLLIAATALDHNLTLVTRNVRHFNRIPGLRLLT